MVTRPFCTYTSTRYPVRVSTVQSIYLSLLDGPLFRMRLGSKNILVLILVCSNMFYLGFLITKNSAVT